jgi:hypothetical protein
MSFLDNLTGFIQDAGDAVTGFIQNAGDALTGLVRRQRGSSRDSAGREDRRDLVAEGGN